jgi:hypothetical protein
MVLGRMQRRLVVAGLASLFAAPAFVIQPAAAAILFTCDSVTGSGTLSPGLVRNQRAQSFSSGPAAPAGPADITLAPTSDSGIKANDASIDASLSADGSKVAFMSRATNLDPADNDTLRDIYVKVLATGDITLASTSDTGVKGNHHSFGPSISRDGTKVAFYSRASNLDPADAEGTHDVYVKDLLTGDITLVSTSDTGVKGNGSSLDPSLSDDGTRVAFWSVATNLDPGDTVGFNDVYVKDLSSGDITLASTSDTGVKGDSDSDLPALSADGMTVAFDSRATNFDPADTSTDHDIYVKDVVTGDIVLASASDAGVKSNDESFDLSLSADGTRVAFGSNATNLDPGDTVPDGSDIYVKELTTGDITLASTSDTGQKGNGLSTRPSLSSDGTRVAFSSMATNVDPADTSTDDDVYVNDLVTGGITLASTSDTGVKGNGSAASLAGDGTRVAFATGLSMDPGDTDAIVDIYLKTLPSVATSIDITDCSNGNSGTASIVDIGSYGSRPLGCPTSLGGAAGNDYPDTTPILVGGTLSMTIDWATGPNSYGVAAAKAGATGVQWRFRLAITASPGHDTPATNQYLPAAGSGATKTRLQGKLDWSANDSFNCASGINDPLSWVSVANNGSWVAKTS